MKLKRMLALVLTIAMVLSVAVLPVNAASIDFTDVAGHWAEGSIERWTEAGVIVGYGDDTFAPDATIKRAEVAEIMRKVLGLVELDENTYTDVPEGSWYEKSVLACSMVDIFEGYDDNTMQPEQPIERIEMFKVLVTAFRLEGGDPATELAAFPDKAQVEEWAEPYTATMIFNNAVEGYDDGTLRPVDDVTRAQMVAMLDRIVGAYVTADGQISLTSEGETKGNIVLVNANCASDVMVTLAEDGKTVKIAVDGGEDRSYITDNGAVYVVIANQASFEVTAAQSIKVVGATEEKQASIEKVAVEQPTPGDDDNTPDDNTPDDNTPDDNTPEEPACEHTSAPVAVEGSCAAGTATCACGAEYEIAAAHDFVNGACVLCDTTEADAMKFALSVEAGDGYVKASVTDDYVAVIESNYGEVNAGSVTVEATMQDVGSLGVTGVRNHKVTIDTGLTGRPSLAEWLGEVKTFDEADVIVNIAGAESFTYNVQGENGTITATPNEVDLARAAWQELTSEDHMVTSTQAADDSYIVISKNSSLQIAGQKLSFEDGAENLTIDPNGGLTGLNETIRASVKLETGLEGEGIVAVLGAGTKLAVGSSVVELFENITIEITGLEADGLDNILSDLRDAGSGQDMAIDLVNLINTVVGNVDGNAVTVNITFG